MKNSPFFSIGRHVIGKGECFVIAEVAQAHDGSLGMAHAYIDAVAKTGVHAIKFQTHIAEAESSYLEPWRVKFSLQDASRFDYWKRMEFTKEQWAGLKSHAEEKGLVFLSSPFSVEAFELLNDLGILAWKIASGEINNSILLKCIRDTGKPILISTGMSNISEIENAVTFLSQTSRDLAVMQCTTSYPTPPQRIGLNLIDEYRKKFQCPIGLSDHSGTIYPGLAGVAIGLDILEIHVTMSKDMFGPDVVASVTIEELLELIKGINYIELMKSNPVNKDILFNEYTEIKGIFGKSLFAALDLKAGTILSERHLSAKKPGTGISIQEIDKIIGKKLKTDITKGQMISLFDLI